MGRSLTTSPELRQITRRIVASFDPERIMLFGSRARKEDTADSDIDLFIEMATPLRGPERAAKVASIFGLRTWPLDIVVYTPEEVKRLRAVHGTLLERIEHEGQVLYERS